VREKNTNLERSAEDVAPRLEVRILNCGWMDGKQNLQKESKCGKKNTNLERSAEGGRRAKTRGKNIKLWMDNTVRASTLSAAPCMERRRWKTTTKIVC
jgi:hypothetical protein